MAETALATPFDSDEIVEIACEEFKKRLRGLSPLYSGKLYNSFALDFNVGIRLIRASGEPVATLAWGNKQEAKSPQTYATRRNPSGNLSPARNPTSSAWSAISP